MSQHEHKLRLVETYPSKTTGAMDVIAACECGYRVLYEGCWPTALHHALDNPDVIETVLDEPTLIQPTLFSEGSE